MTITAHDTTATVTATVLRPVTLEAPRSLSDATAPDDLRTALEVFATLADMDEVQAVALANVAIALQENGAVVVTYSHDGITTGRVIYPTRVFLTKDNAVCVRGFCTFRREVKSFRLDRMEAVHPLVFPGEDAAPIADAEAA